MNLKESYSQGRSMVLEWSRFSCLVLPARNRYLEIMCQMLAKKNDK